MTQLADRPVVTLFGHCGTCRHVFTSTADQDSHLHETGHGRIEFVVDAPSGAEERPPSPGGAPGTGRPAHATGRASMPTGPAPAAPAPGAGPDLHTIRDALAMHPAGTGPARWALTPQDRAAALRGLARARSELAQARRRPIERISVAGGVL